MPSHRCQDRTVSVSSTPSVYLYRSLYIYIYPIYIYIYIWRGSGSSPCPWIRWLKITLRRSDSGPETLAGKHTCPPYVCPWDRIGDRFGSEWTGRGAVLYSILYDLQSLYFCCCFSVKMATPGSTTSCSICGHTWDSINSQIFSFCRKFQETAAGAADYKISSAVLLSLTLIYGQALLFTLRENYIFPSRCLIFFSKYPIDQKRSSFGPSGIMISKHLSKNLA